jgi:hypothetical protein
VLLAVGCTASGGPQASAARRSSPTPKVANPADSKAVDLRTALDLLLGEHVIIVAKVSAAATGPEPAFASYASLLGTNGNALGDLMHSAFGDSAGSQFDQMWTSQNSYLVDYAIGVVTHNQSKSNGAMSGLLNGFEPQFSRWITSQTQLPADSTTRLIHEQVLETKAMIDDQFAPNFPKMYAVLHAAYAQASQLGDALSPKIALMFPDKFPGETSSPAADLRVSINSLLQEHTYLATMATSATVANRSAEQAAAARALADNTRSLGALFGGLIGAPTGTQLVQILSARDRATIAYASASGGTATQSARNQMSVTFVSQLSGFLKQSTGVESATSRAPIEAQVQATVTVIDDQRSRSLTRIGADDRSAAGAMQNVADLIAGAIVSTLIARFGA